MIARVLSFTRATRNGAKVSDVEVDPGGGPNVTPEHYAPAGDDSQPLDTDYAFSVRDRGSNRFVTVGYLDPDNEGKTGPGEKRVYARDDSGAVVAEVWLKNDGSVVVSNDDGSITLESGGDITLENTGVISATNGSGSFSLESNGDILLNGVKITPAGSIETASIVVNGKELAEHTHPVTTAPGTTGPNNP